MLRWTILLCLLPLASCQNSACLQNVVTNNAEEVLRECPSLSGLSDLETLCNDGNCVNLLTRLYALCDYYPFNGVCVNATTTSTSSSGTPITPSRGTLFPSDSTQAECIAAALSASTASIDAVCDTQRLASEVYYVCDHSDCYNFLSPIFEGCGYSELRILCNSVSPATLDPTSTGVFPEPNEEQAQCIYNAAARQTTDLMNYCGSIRTTTDVFNSCINEACYELIIQIYASCNYNYDGSVCVYSGGTPPPGPSVEQSQCFSRAVQSQIQEITRDCNSDELPLIANGELTGLCGSQHTNCFNRIVNIYNGCGYNYFAESCGSGGLNNLPTPSPTQFQCIRTDITAQGEAITRECGSAQFDDIRAICNNLACFTRLSSIYSKCGYTALTQACNGGVIGGGIITGGTGSSPDIPTPSTSQALCISEHSANRISELATQCSGIDRQDAKAICSNANCYNVISEIYSGCGYNHLATACGGSVKIYAISGLVFLFAMLTIIFQG